MSRNNEERIGARAAVEGGPPTVPNEGSFSFATPTEFVELPSGGKYYPEGHPLHMKDSVEIRYMTAKDEDILSSKTLLQKGVAIERFLNNVLIDKSIDRGKVITKSTIEVYKDDTLIDLNIRIQNLEQKLMIDSILLLKKNIPTQVLGEGTYYRSVPEDIEKTLHQKFTEYKNKNGK